MGIFHLIKSLGSMLLCVAMLLYCAEDNKSSSNQPVASNTPINNDQNSANLEAVSLNFLNGNAEKNHSCYVDGDASLRTNLSDDSPSLALTDSRGGQTLVKNSLDNGIICFKAKENLLTQCHYQECYSFAQLDAQLKAGIQNCIKGKEIANEDQLCDALENNAAEIKSCRSIDQGLVARIHCANSKNLREKNFN